MIDHETLTFPKLAMRSATSGSIAVGPFDLREFSARVLRIPAFGRLDVEPSTDPSPVAGPLRITRHK